MFRVDNNAHENWQQGKFIDGVEYSNMGEVWKRRMKDKEKKLVRPSPRGNPICMCFSEDDAKWIAERLNLAAKYERELKENG